MRYEAINFENKLALFDEQWAPKVIAEMNDYQFKIVKMLLIEPRGVLNTGHEGGDRTAENDVWIWNSS